MNRSRAQPQWSRTRSAGWRRLTPSLMLLLLTSNAILSGLVPGPASAEEWAFLGARYQGMGGAGVAVVDDEHASYWNPGALAFTPSYGASIPIGVQAAAEGSVLADVDRVARLIDELDAGAFDQLLADIEGGGSLDAAQLRTAIDLAAVRLPGLDSPGKGLVGNANASLLLRYERVALSGIGLGYLAADPVFDAVNVSVSSLEGAAAVDAIVDPATAMDRYAAGSAPDLVARLETLFASVSATSPSLQAEELVFQAEQAGVDVRDGAIAQNLLNVANATVGSTGNSFADNRSGAFVRGLAVEEVGIAYGHPLWKRRIGIGAQLKYLHGTTFNKFVRFDEVDGGADLIDEIGDSSRRKSSHTASLDLGLLVKPWSWLRFGLTARNVTEPAFDLARDPTNPSGRGELTLDPQVRAGVALWILPQWVVAFDADLTKNESRLLEGFESRIVSLGTELRIPIWKLGLALRGGAYLNAAGEDPGAIALTAGLGIRLFDLHLDLAAGASPQTERVEAADDSRLPARMNLSATLSFRRAF